VEQELEYRSSRVSPETAADFLMPVAAVVDTVAQRILPRIGPRAKKRESRVLRDSGQGRLKGLAPSTVRATSQEPASAEHETPCRNALSDKHLGALRASPQSSKKHSEDRFCGRP
jgi:hypothetical protein